MVTGWFLSDKYQALALSIALNLNKPEKRKQILFCFNKPHYIPPISPHSHGSIP